MSNVAAATISLLTSIGFTVTRTAEAYAWAHYAGVDAPARVQDACAYGAAASAEARGEDVDMAWTFNGYTIETVVATAWSPTPADLYFYGTRPDGTEILFESFEAVTAAIAKVA